MAAQYCAMQTSSPPSRGTWFLIETPARNAFTVSRSTGEEASIIGLSPMAWRQNSLSIRFGCTLPQS